MIFVSSFYIFVRVIGRILVPWNRTCWLDLGVCIEFVFEGGLVCCFISIEEETVWTSLVLIGYCVTMRVCGRFDSEEEG